MALYSRKRNRKDYVRGPELKSVGYVFQDDQWHAVPNEPAITGPHFFGLAAPGAPPGVLSWQLCKPLCINVVLEGSNGANRTGTAINMHKLSVKVLAMRQLNGVVDGVNQSLLIQNRLMIVYDKGGDISGAHGFSPKIQEIIGVPNPVHAAPYLTVWADQITVSGKCLFAIKITTMYTVKNVDVIQLRHYLSNYPQKSSDPYCNRKLQ